MAQTVSLQTEVKPGQKRDPQLEQQMKKIEDALNQLLAVQAQLHPFLLMGA